MEKFTQIKSGHWQVTDDGKEVALVEDANDGGVERWIYVDEHDDLVLIDSDDNEVSSLLMLKVANALIDISGYQEKFEFDEFN